jgi:peptidoglycan DL-endopeptidase CwlO
MKKRIICSMLALSISFGGITYATPDGGNTDIATLRKQLEENNSKKDGIQSEIDELDSKLTVATDEMIKMQEEYDKIKSEIDGIKKDLESAEKRYNERNAKLNSRVEAMYKSGNIGYVEVILSSESIGDFFTRVDMVKNLVNHDQTVIAELKTEKDTIDTKKKELEVKFTQAEKAKADSEAKKNELVAAAQAKEALVAELESKNQNLTAQIGNLEAEAAAAAERAAAEAAAAAQTVSREESAREPNANNTGSTTPTTTPEAESVPSGSGSAVVSKAYAYLGVPYVWGGSSPSGFDCSGLTSYVYRQVGVSLPRTARQQQNFGTKVSLSALQPGDLVFWGSPAHHVGIYIGGGKYIHAPQTGDVVKVSTLKGATSATRVLR